MYADFVMPTSYANVLQRGWIKRSAPSRGVEKGVLKMQHGPVAFSTMRMFI